MAFFGLGRDSRRPRLVDDFGTLNVGVLYVLAISSLVFTAIMIGGGASNSKYPFMGRASFLLRQDGVLRSVDWLYHSDV